MNKSTATKEINDRAIEWFVRLRAIDITETERESFFDWLHAVPEHGQGFVDVCKMWEGLSIVQQMDF